jgi:hypothetical protein
MNPPARPEANSEWTEFFSEQQKNICNQLEHRFYNEYGGQANGFDANALAQSLRLLEDTIVQMDNENRSKCKKGLERKLKSLAKVRRDLEENIPHHVKVGSAYHMIVNTLFNHAVWMLDNAPPRL